jgi:RimJ/RimL family protein N-acetyltransferase
VESHNTPSIRAVEYAGFVRTSDGVRTTRFGSRLLGAYALTPRNE